MRCFTIVCVLIAFAVTALIALRVGQFALPLNDDFARAYRGRSEGTLAYVNSMYFEWFGRWLATGISATLLSVSDFHRTYPWLLLIPFVGQVIAIRVAVAQLSDGASKSRMWCVSAMAAILLWACAPHVNEFYYWFTGAVEYSMSVSLGLCVVALGSDAARKGGFKAAPLLSTVALVMAVLVGGLHELAAMVLCLTLVSGACLSKGEAGVRRLWYALLGAGAVGLFINLLAPGNFVRPAKEGIHTSVVGAAKAISWDVMHEAVAWLQDGKLWCATVAALCWFALTPTPTWRTVPSRTRWLAPVLTVVALAIWLTLPAAAAGWVLTPRSATACYTVCFFGWWATLWVWAPEVRAYFRLGPLLVPRVGFVVATAALAGLLLLTGNAPDAAAALYRRIPAWHTAALARHDRAVEMALAGQRNVVLPFVPPAPATFMQADIGTDSGDWRNRDWARTHGLETVSVASRADTPCANTVGSSSGP